MRKQAFGDAVWTLMRAEQAFGARRDLGVDVCVKQAYCIRRFGRWSMTEQLSGMWRGLDAEVCGTGVLHTAVRALEHDGTAVLRTGLLSDAAARMESG